ncbi:MAG: hypothetical protein C5B50_29560 [Verrucomicrobia bacterium]|nr:MAG: hypothetical protein C5B50_29560 [Verrucomicrobiota bacterium]
MSFEEQVLSNCDGLARDRVRIINLRNLNLAALLAGVVFVFATWSGQAVRSFRLLCQALAATPESNLPVFVLDADGFDFDEFRKVFGELSHGKGEAYWIRDGESIHKDHGYTDESRNLLIRRIQDSKGLNQPS